MSIDTVTIDGISLLLNKWYPEIRARNLLRAKEVRNEITSKLQGIELERTSKLYIQYLLLEYRYQLLIEDLSQAEQVLETIEPVQQMDYVLQFYYQFFKAIHCTLKENYSESRRYFENSDKLLKWVSDPMEIAEYYYKVAEFYYHIEQPLLALHIANKAKESFSLNGYEIKRAGCENILGLSCILLKQFEKAEEHLLTGLDLILKQNEESLVLLFRYNLGFLYSEQNLSQVAIHHLDEAYNKNFRLHKTAFLLAREHYKLNNASLAEKLISEGLESCSKEGNKEYEHHLKILQMFHNDLCESTLEEGILYFEREELWGYIQEYTEEAALHFLNFNNYEKASSYFLTAFKAKQKLVDKGALK
ncbi:tetratricopeptide repeat protein [Fictibacillus nanhaiensis]|uniref:response regulator aspartate phosphatase n=1 Tax=Fictibacillus nanhaiensis TaxID=742169 RepID=UPI001C98D03A|nr:tetratricopeptide repeat protein [Fictibacillus nanhaiensis]MBY6036911.1 tetratricopeptide repeat protein [Fictibacillus nanhaiensis]